MTAEILTAVRVRKELAIVAYELEKELGRLDAMLEPSAFELFDVCDLRRYIRQRRLRDLYFDRGLFADPAWDILLDLAAAQQEKRPVSISSACVAANVAPTTALRWIARLVNTGMIVRIADRGDRRRAHLQLSDQAQDAMHAYLARIARDFR